MAFIPHYFDGMYAFGGNFAWLIIAPTAFVIIVALYELLVRRVGVLRFLFGMKPLPKAAMPRALNTPLGSARS